VFLLQFVANTKLGSVECNFDGRMLIKRFHGDHVRPGAIISTLSGVPRTDEPATPMDIHSQEDVWMCVTPVAHDSGDNGDKDPQLYSKIECTHRFRLSFDEDALESSRQRVGMLTHVILDKIKNDTNKKHASVDALLSHST